MSSDNMERQQPQHPHYHHEHHHHHHHHHNEDDDDDDRLSADDYEQLDSDDQSSSYASRALRRFTVRAAVHDRTRLRTVVGSEWPPHHADNRPDSQLLYQQASTCTPVTNIHDDAGCTGKPTHIGIIFSSFHSMN